MASRPISRRGFIGALAVAGAAGVAAGITGCSDSTTQTAETANTTAPQNVSQTYDVDILVVGLGMSGLTAAVQAGLLGANTLGIEKMGVTGGDGIGVEGIFAIDSSLEKQQGIEIDPVAVIKGEIESSQWVANGNLWMKLVKSSGANVDWLIEQGVQFSGVIDDYHGNSEYQDFHWFNGNVASTGYIPQMTAKAKELGVQMLFDTPCTSLITEDGKVVGAYAQNVDDGDIQINAKAVILATGSWGQNEEYIKQRGFNYENFRYGGVDGHTGDGVMMATKIGGRNFVSNATFNSTNTIGDFKYKSAFIWNAGGGGSSLFVNENADRFINEDFGQSNFELQSVPALTHKQMYSVFDRSILEGWLAAAADELETVDTADDDDLFVADTLEEAATAAGLDVDAFMATIRQYNSICTAGVDTDFGKNLKFLAAIEHPPYYIGRLTQMFLIAIGGVETNENCQVVDNEKTAIEGLYAIGTDGCMIYRNIYTINVGGTCNANNVNSGRVAAQHACESI